MQIERFQKILNKLTTLYDLQNADIVAYDYSFKIVLDGHDVVRINTRTENNKDHHTWIDFDLVEKISEVTMPSSEPDERFSNLDVDEPPF